MDIWPGSHVQHVKPNQQTNKCQCQCQATVLEVLTLATTILHPFWHQWDTLQCIFCSSHIYLKSPFTFSNASMKHYSHPVISDVLNTLCDNTGTVSEVVSELHVRFYDTVFVLGFIEVIQDIRK
jgi:hypothetical protein